MFYNNCISMVHFPTFIVYIFVIYYFERKDCFISLFYREK